MRTSPALFLTLTSAALVTLSVPVPADPRTTDADAQAQPDASPAAAPIPLSKDDRKRIERDLGDGVVGRALPATPITDPSSLFPLESGRTWTYKTTHGPHKGRSETYSLSKLDQSEAPSWYYKRGSESGFYLRHNDDGSLDLMSEELHGRGLIVTYRPPQPVLIADLEAGGSRSFDIDIKVYDLSNPDNLKYHGSMKVTFTYVGMYRTRVPAGTFDAALLRWSLEGDVSLAHIKETQYRLVAPEIGVVASVELDHISALLIYQDTTKVGRVLTDYETP